MPKIARAEVLSVCLAIALIGGTDRASAQDAPPAQTSIDVLIAEGASIYQNQCARCHGKRGQGQRHNHDAAPRLGGHFARLSVAEVTGQIIRGGAYMPPFGALTDREIAAVATFVRNSFGNSLGPVIEADIAQNR